MLLCVAVTIQSLELIKFLNSYYGDTDEEGHWKVADVSCFHLVAPICLTPDHMDHPKGHNPIFRAVWVKSKTKDKSITLLNYMNFPTLMWDNHLLLRLSKATEGCNIPVPRFKNIHLLSHCTEFRVLKLPTWIYVYIKVKVIPNWTNFSISDFWT